MNGKITDWIGEKVSRESCPRCTEHPDCFACVEGYCTALKIPDGRRANHEPDVGECGFYQPAQVVRENCNRGYRRLIEIGRRGLISKYLDTMFATGVMDEEIREADLEAASFEQFRESNFNEQMEQASLEKQAETDENDFYALRKR